MGLPGKRNQLHVVLGQGSRVVTVKPCDLETQAAPPWEGSAVPIAAYLGRCSFTLFACKVLPIPEREPPLRRLGVKAEFDPPSPMLCSALCSFQNRVLDQSQACMACLRHLCFYHKTASYSRDTPCLDQSTRNQ